MVESTIPLVLDVIRTVGILAGIYYYIVTIRSSEKNRRMQIFLRLWEDFTSEEWLVKHYELAEQEWDNIEDFFEKYVNPRESGKRMAILMTLNGIGLAVKEGYVDIKIVYDYGGYGIVGFWEKFKEILLHERELYNRPDLYVGLEYLSAELVKYRRRMGASTELPGLDKRLGRW